LVSFGKALNPLVVKSLKLFFEAYLNEEWINIEFFNRSSRFSNEGIKDFSDSVGKLSLLQVLVLDFTWYIPL